jgi:two-component SAPR family response regulator
MNIKKNNCIPLYILTTIFLLFFIRESLWAKELSESSFLVASVNHSNIQNQSFWDFIQSDNNTGLEIGLSEERKSVTLSNTEVKFDILFEKLKLFTDNDSTKIIPVFLNYNGQISVLDSVISNSILTNRIFYLPQGEAWPPVEYLIQSDRRILFFVKGEYENPGRILHQTGNYVHRISASPSGSSITNRTNLELFMIEDFDKLPTSVPSAGNIRNLVPDYINFLLENWTKYGKRPNFIFVGDNIFNFDFIISQLNSFTWFKGTIRGSGKTLEKIYWRNPEVLFTGGRFSFPYRGGDELTLTPFVPGYRMTPEHIIVTGEMEVPENYSIIATPLNINQGLKSSFLFDNVIQNKVFPEKIFNGENYSFVQDIERGPVLRLPENSNVNLGPPDIYGLRNSSFTVSCFVKFSEIMEFGDNAVLGNYESEYRRGLHLILRSGHPYFGLWANDYVSEEKLVPNIWYHLVWRYILETGEQAIFLNGRNIGSSDGHPPFSGTGDIHLGSALSQGASLRGYIDDLHFWNRPLGSEEISRLALNEEIIPEAEETTSSGSLLSSWKKPGLVIIVFLILSVLSFFLLTNRKKRKVSIPFNLPEKNRANQINLFGEFFAIDREGNNISTLFTPKVRELLLFTILSTLKNETGASVADIDEQLWPGLPTKKVINNRAVTLNKLRKILSEIDGIEIITHNGYLKAKLEKSFFCDYAQAYDLCQIPGGMDKNQLETFFMLVKKGRFMKGTDWHWLDEMRGYTGNQIIDNLLKLAAYYKIENNLPKIEALAKRILEYDDLNEEAVWLLVWVQRQLNNIHQAKYHFESFCAKYRVTLGEPYSLNFDQFNSHFSDLLKINGIKYS